MDSLLANKVYGHDRAVTFLSQAIASQNVPQSLLITGLPQIGKATLAHALAKTLICEQSNGLCDGCPACRKIDSGNHPDVTIMDQPGETLKIEQIRELQHDLSLRPHTSAYKIAILCDFERATTAAANALLKTLEEPPAYVILVLTSKDTTHLLPTIVSRCQNLHLKPIPSAIIAQTLETQRQATPEEAQLLSRLASGRLGWAISALNNPDQLTQRQQYLEDILQISQANYSYRLSYAYTLTQKNHSIGDVLNMWLSWWRDVMLIHSGITDGVINVDAQEKLMWFAQQLTGQQIIEAVKQIRTALHHLDYNVNRRLNLEVLLLNLPRLEPV